MKTRSFPRLYVEDRGDGEPVLLITGWTISSAVFDPVAAHYTDTLRVVSYDHRGTGRSDLWPTWVSIAMLAADAARVLDDRGIRAAHVVGLSMGAGGALELALRMPDRVKSLILVGGTAGGPATTLPAPGEAGAALGTLVRDTVRHRYPWPAAMLFSPRFREQHPDRVASFMPAFAAHRAPPWAAWAQTVAVSCFGRAGSLGAITAPTLVLHGGKDVMTPPGNARTLAAGIPDAELQLIPGAGHAVPLEEPELSAQIIRAFVARHAQREPPPRGLLTRTQEQLTRPLSLHTGTLRNTLDAVGLLTRRW